MEIELNYNEISELKDLVTKRMKYFDMLRQNSDCYEEYQYWEDQMDALRKLHEKIWDYYKKAKEEIAIPGNRGDH